MPFVPAKCTQCGANIEVDPSKDAGICKYCGTAFVTEKAINNYNVNITNNFDGANINVLGCDIENLITIGQAALDVGNSQEAYEYSNRALELDAKSAKAWILKMHAVGSFATIEDDKTTEIISYGYKAIEASNEDDEIRKEVYLDWLVTATSMIDNITNHLSDVDELKARVRRNETYSILHDESLLRDVALQVVANALNFAFTIPKDYSLTKDCLTDKYIDIANKYLLFCEKDLARTELYRSAALAAEPLVTERKDTLSQIKDRIPADKHERIVGPEIRPPKSSGCYIATAVYGSYNCPEVWTLRRFRDYYLDEHALGRLFIKCYYMLSPALVRKYGDAKWFQITWRRLLNKFVEKLIKNGYKDTPYRDK